MKNLEQLGLKVLQSLDPERAHNLAIKALQMGLVPKPRSRRFPRLNSQLAGLTLPNPIGLAAGFDKNAQALNGLAACGFGFLEIGAATPVAQPGNPKPRLFRLPSDRAVINRFGFNNDGMAQIALRLQKRPKHPVMGLILARIKTAMTAQTILAGSCAIAQPILILPPSMSAAQIPKNCAIYRAKRRYQP